MTDKQYRNITVDADLLDLIHALADRLEGEFGFRPTISQLLRYALKNCA